MMRRSLRLAPALALCFWMGAANPASAQFVNGNFETGSFTGWGVVTNSIASVTLTPPTSFTNGTNQAVLSSGNLGADPDFPTLASALTAGNSLGFTLTAAQLQTLTGSANAAQNGSAIFQQFSGVGVLTFNFGWNNGEGFPAGIFRDNVFVWLDGTLTSLRDANANATDSSYATFTSSSLSSGQHFIAVGTINGFDSQVSSDGVFDNFTISGASVPEPSTMVLLGGLAVAAAGYRPVSRRLKRRLRKA